MEKTHWRKILEKDHLGSVDLDTGNGEYKDITATIKEAVREKVKDMQSGEEEICLVLRFQEQYKPMIMNVTNAKMMQKLTNSKYIQDWAGVKIQIGTEKVKAFGEYHDALRIRGFLPKSDSKATIHKCSECEKEIKGTPQIKADALIAGTKKAYGVELCFDCAKKRKETADAKQ